MAHKLDSPFDNMLSPKDTTPQSGNLGGSGSHPIVSNPMTGGFPVVNQFVDVPASSATYDSPFDMALAKSTSKVTGHGPGGSAPVETPFADALDKKKP